MSKHPKSAAIAAWFILAFPVVAAARDYTVGALKIGDPWSSPTPQAALTAVGYLTITNTGREPDRFLGGSTPAAAAAIQIHQMSMTGGIARMRQITDGLELAPGQTVKLDPNGFHLMLVGPKRPFKVGDHIPATLNFARAGKVKVEFDVQAGPPVTGDHAHMVMH